MVCFRDFDTAKTNNTITTTHTQTDTENYTVIEDDICLRLDTQYFNDIYSVYSISEVCKYIEINKYSTDYVSRQLRMDVPRSLLYCNSELVEEVDEFINYLGWKTMKNNKLYKIIGFFCTQIVFAFPITIIQQKLNAEGGDYYICELKDRNKSGYTTHLSLYTTADGRVKYTIDICKKLRLCKIPMHKEPVTIYKFSLLLNIRDGNYNVDVLIE